jgi:cytochrome c oxidase subunit 2
MKPPVVHSPFHVTPGPAPLQGPKWGTFSWSRTLAQRLVPAAVALLASGCDGGNREKYPMTIYEPRSEFADALLDLQNLTTYLGVAVGLVVFIAMGYIMYRFRHRPGAAEPEQVHGNTRLELAWTLLPALILAVIAVPTVQTIFATQPEPPADALTIDAIGWQWWWEFQYPMGADTVVTANEIHVPVGRTVQVRLRGGDVVHNFWVPQMGGKRYAIPNRVNSIIFTPSEPGMYLGQCAEFCGASHALMKMRLIAHTPEDFERWLRHEASPAVEPVDSAVALGKQLVTGGACAGCHIIEGTAAQFGRTGPNLTHFARRTTLAAGILENNAQNLAAWIDDPQAIKPGALMPDLGLSPEEIQYIVAYLQTLY